MELIGLLLEITNMNIKIFMKKLLFILITTFFLVSANAQTIKRSSINSVGFTSPNLSFSVGQYMAESFKTTSSNITIGYQQALSIFLDTALSLTPISFLCSGDTVKLKVVPAPYVKWFKNDTLITGKDSSFLFVLTPGKYKAALSDGLGHSDTTRVITIQKFEKPPVPTLSRDTSNFLVSTATYGNTWDKDGVALNDTSVKIKPNTPGYYTVKTTQNGCTSIVSSTYYFILTDLITLSASEFIKLGPNPFANNIRFDFNVRGYQKMNIDVYEISTGRKVSSRIGLTTGTTLTFDNLSTGIFVFNVISQDGKISHQFKLVKL